MVTIIFEMIIIQKACRFLLVVHDESEILRKMLRCAS